MIQEPASNGCSQPRKPAPKWAAPTPSPPTPRRPRSKSHNHCAEVLGGLTTALALARRGRSSRVLEGAPEFGAIGYGIQFGPNVFHVFDRLGLMDQVLAVADAPKAVVFLDAIDGKELVRIPTGASFRARFKYPYVIVHRVDVHDVLLDACRANGAIELVADATVTG